MGIFVIFSKEERTAAPQTATLCAVLPGILLRVLEVFWDESKVFAQFQPQVRLWHPAIVGMDGVVLGQLSRDQPEM